MHRYFKIASFLLALVLAFSLVGCGGSSESASNETNKEVEKTEDTKKQEEEKATEPAPAPSEPAPSNGEPAASVDSSNPQTSSENTVSGDQPATNNTQPAPAAQPKVAAPTQSKAQPAPAPSQPAPAAVSNPEPADSVTISIVGPKDKGTLLGSKKVEIKAGNTVMDVLLKAAGNNVEYSGSGSTAYVEGIYNVYELDYGPQSGWTYKLNGAMVQKSAGVVEVKDGDQIVWTYVEG